MYINKFPKHKNTNKTLVTTLKHFKHVFYKMYKNKFKIKLKQNIRNRLNKFLFDNCSNKHLKII